MPKGSHMGPRIRESDAGNGGKLWSQRWGENLRRRGPRTKDKHCGLSPCQDDWALAVGEAPSQASTEPHTPCTPRE